MYYCLASPSSIILEINNKRQHTIVKTNCWAGLAETLAAYQLKVD